MRKTHIILLLLLDMVFHSGSSAQVRNDSIELYTDKSCYLVGERLHVSVFAEQTDKEEASRSRIAYLELADTAGTAAQTMLWLEKGEGWAELSIPFHLHSGNYLLTAYTRSRQNGTTEDFAQKIVSIVQPQHTSPSDQVLFLPPEDDMQPRVEREYKPGQKIVVSLPRDSIRLIRVLSLIRNDLPTADYTSYPYRILVSRAQETLIPEMEGHIMKAHPTTKDLHTSESRMVLVGKGSYVYDGKEQKDGSWLYFTTTNLHDPQPTLLNGYDSEGRAAPLELASPYLGVRPSSLPPLQVWCTRETLQARSVGAQQEAAITHWLQTDTLAHRKEILSGTPEYTYDLDEYKKFSTVKEVLVEFVKGVKKKKVHGVNRLFTRFENENGYSDWPALVLFDGMPVNNIDDILEYDARLLKYIEIYNQVFTFGSSVCQGIISFVSHQGRLSNYKLDEGSRLVVYDFPQDHPLCIMPTSSKLSTVYWNPSVGSTRTTLTAPSVPGLYQILLQGIDQKGRHFQSTSIIHITE